MNGQECFFFTNSSSNTPSLRILQSKIILDASSTHLLAVGMHMVEDHINEKGILEKTVTKGEHQLDKEQDQHMDIGQASRKEIVRKE